MITITCPDCNRDNPLGAKFCQICGTSLTANCRRCGTSNGLGAEFCGNCGIRLSEATLGIPKDEAKKWQEAFASIGWIEEAGPRTKQLFPQLQPPLDASQEEILFLAYNGARNRIQDVQIDNVNFRRNYIGVLATNWRIIFFDIDKMKLYAFSYEDIATVEKPGGGGVMKEVKYVLNTRSGHAIRIIVRLDAPGLIGVIAGFNNPVTAGHVLSHKERAAEVITFLNHYFTRIVPPEERVNRVTAKAATPDVTEFSTQIHQPMQAKEKQQLGPVESLEVDKDLMPTQSRPLTIAVVVIVIVLLLYFFLR